MKLFMSFRYPFSKERSWPTIKTSNHYAISSMLLVFWTYILHLGSSTYINGRVGGNLKGNSLNSQQSIKYTTFLTSTRVSELD